MLYDPFAELKQVQQKQHFVELLNQLASRKEEGCYHGDG